MGRSGGLTVRNLVDDQATRYGEGGCERSSDENVGRGVGGGNNGL